MTISVTSTVEFKTPFADEIGCVYRVVELNGDRCFIEIVTINGKAWDGALVPQTLAMVAELQLAGA